MLTVEQLIEYTRVYKPLVLKKAREVSVKLGKPVVMEDSDGDKFTLINAKCRGETVVRNVEIHLYGKGKKAQCWVSCDCEWFCYASEVALTKKGSSEINFSNGQKYTKSGPNSRGVPNVCKHVAACFLAGAHNLKAIK
jgi:hypothetical protein